MKDGTKKNENNKNETKQDIVNTILRALPSVDLLTNEVWFSKLENHHSRGLLIKATRNALDTIRMDVLSGVMQETPSISDMQKKIEIHAMRLAQGNFRKIINGTGVVLHTNLGRAPLCQKALETIRDVAEGYSNLEFNLGSGERGSRHSIVEQLICELIGAEGAMVVNNNAAAVMLVLSELSKNKEVVVSRGQLVEIGGSFRIPDVMVQSGAILKEVGTTNKTHLKDYESAVNENTAALMKIHTSNYRICGFTQEVDQADMVALGQKYGIPVIEDLGSGSLLDLSEYGLPYEPTVQEALISGMDIVTFSGDKLLGGPQTGIIAGRKELIERVKRHPLARAFRIDKLSLAALEGTLIQYLDKENAIKMIPALRMLTRSYEELVGDGENLLRVLKEAVNVDLLNEGIKSREIEGKDIEMSLEDDYSEVGGGSMPLHKMKTVVVAIQMTTKSPDELSRLLRKGQVAVVGRIAKNKFLLDVRTVSENEYKPLVDMLVAAFNST